MSTDTKFYVYFAFIELVGSVLAGILLARYYRKSTANGVWAGITTTIIGVLLYLAITNMRGLSVTAFLLILIPLRTAEWGLVFWLFFGRPFMRPTTLMLILAICWSFAVDMIGSVFGFFASGTQVY